MPHSSQDVFARLAPNPEILNPQAYYELLLKLATQGQGRGKTIDVTAYKLNDIKVRTLTASGEHETDRDIQVDPVYICFDQDKWPPENIDATNWAIEDLGRNWGKKIALANTASHTPEIEDIEDEIKRILDMPDLERAGVYVQKAKGFEEDYVPTQPGSPNYSPNPEATRVIIDLEEDTKVLMPWGEEFLIEKGGSLVIREREGHFPDLVKALQQIQDGDDPANLLYNEDGNPKFDVYGMHPGFNTDNYGDRGLKVTTQELQRTMAGQKGPSVGPRPEGT